MLGVAVQTTAAVVVVGSRPNCAPGIPLTRLYVSVTLGLTEHTVNTVGLVRVRVAFCATLVSVDSTACPAPQLFGDPVAVRFSLKGIQPVPDLVQVTVSRAPAATAQVTAQRSTEQHSTAPRVEWLFAED